MRLEELASLVDGEIIGRRDIEITGASGINEAQKGHITFIASKKYLKDLLSCNASCVITKEPIADLNITQLKVSNPYLAFAKILTHFYVQAHKTFGISNEAYISDKTRLGKNVSIYPFSYISDDVSIGDETVIYPFVFIGENCEIGERCIIYPNVSIREKVKIGKRVIIHSGTVIGSDGFGYVFDEDKKSYFKIPQVGGVVIEDDVEIGSNVSIDRATTGNTIISKGTKIDNLVQVAHNVKIGENSIIVAQVGIGGSTEIGNFVTLAGQVGITDHAKIDTGTMVGAKSGVTGHLFKGMYSGIPAIPHKNWLKAQAIFAKLPELYRKIRELEKKILELERRTHND